MHSKRDLLEIVIYYGLPILFGILFVLAFVLIAYITEVRCVSC